MTDLIAAVIDLARRKRAHVAALGLALAAVAGLGLTAIRFESDVLELIPQGGPSVRSFQTFVRRFDTLAYVFVLFEAPDGESISDYQELVESYVMELRAAPEIAYVDYTLFDDDKEWSYLLDRLLLLLGREDATQALSRFESGEIDAALARSRDALGIPSPALRALVRRDPLGLTLLLREKFADNKAFVHFDPSAEGYVSADGRARLVIAKPTAAPYDAAFCHQLMDALREVEARARKRAASVEDSGEPPPPAVIEIAGAYRDTYEAESQIRGEMKRNVFGSLGLILAGVLIVFRSQWILLCSALTLGLSALLAMVVVSAIRGELLAAASGGAAMLFGLGIDGIMMLYVRYLEERGRGLEFDEATDRLSSTAVGVFLGSVTTVATFAALMFVDFPSLEEIGRLVGLGMILCLVLTLLFVPALLAYRRPVAPRWPLRLGNLGEFVEKRSSPILWLAGLLTVLSVLLLPRLTVVATIDRIQPQTAGLAVERKLASQFGIAKEVLLVLTEGTTLDPMLVQHGRLREAFAARRPDLPLASPLSFLPTLQEQSEVAEAIAASGLTAPEITQRFERAMGAAGFRPGVFDPFLEGLATMVDPSERLTYQGLLDHGLGPVVSRFISGGPQGFAVATYAYPSDATEVRELADEIMRLDPSFQVTGQALVNAELKDAFAPEFARGVVIGLGAVLVLLYAGFRSIRLTLLSMLPVVLGLLWSAGLFALVGFELDMFSAFGVVMVIGIGVDYGIHVLHRSRAETDQPVRIFLPNVGAGVAIAALTTAIGFGTLAFSSYRPLGALGITASLSVVLVAIAALLVLPALMVWRRS